MQVGMPLILETVLLHAVFQPLAMLVQQIIPPTP